ncbi:ATP-binding protein [Candidatus Omnitrophota bacterium]
MRIAVASGKGGTGKTTVATNLVSVIASHDDTVAYVDCDVEEPNGHIFLKPVVEKSDGAVMPYPEVNNSLCVSCGKCAEICQYRAIVMLGDDPFVTPEMCHACGGCWLVCPVDAITPVEREIGGIETGWSSGIRFIHGKLAIGQIMSPPLIRMVKNRIPEDSIAVIDCPPGTSCPVITAVQGADYVLLVTEPTPFGLHDLKLAIEVVRKLDIPHGVFINRSDIGNQETERYCEQRSIEILEQFPDNRAVAEAYSKGELASDALPEVRELYESLYDKLKRKIKS